MVLDPTLIDTIQDNRIKSIQQKQLTKELLEIAYREKWFKIWVPKEFGGLELALIEGCQFLEDLAYWDGGLSWTITLCSGANMFVGFIDREAAKRAFSDPKVCFGGSGKVSSKAVEVEGGYRVSGIWPYATGAPHLTHFTANAAVFVDGNNEKSFAFKSLFIPREQVLIHYDWNTFGLEATASHSFSVDNLFVPYNQAFDILPENAQHPSLLFQYPFKPFAELTLFVNYLGIFRRFCDLVQKYFHQKSNDMEWNQTYGTVFFKLLDKAQHLVEISRENIYFLAAQSWNHLLEGHPSSGDNEAIYHEIADKTRLYVQDMKGHIMELFPKCGIRAAQSDEELNSVFRNFFTATQHSLLNIRS